MPSVSYIGPKKPAYQRVGKKTVGEALIFSGVEQRSARESHKLEVTGSNPVTATNIKLNAMIEKLEKLLNVKITEDWPRNPELSIYTQSTVDGYEVFIITNDDRNINWEEDVYYYEPSFEDIIERIKDVSYDYDDEQTVIYCSDIEQFFNEYEIEDYVEQHEDEDE